MREPVVGIDLGTTYSAVATVRDGRPQIIPRRDGGRLTPSMVGFAPSGERVVGEKARLLAEELPDHVAFATKRFLGRRWSAELAASARGVVPYALVSGPSGDVRVKVAGRAIPITQVSAMVLSELKLDAEAYFGRPVRRAVITVPANFDDGQRTATKEAARIAGLEVMRLVNEPTSAAMAYGLAAQFQGRALVFDLGGGTLDVSILEVEKGVFEVKATGGDPQLGGEDFDQRIAQWLLAQVPESFREAAAKDRLSLQRLRTAAERAKRELTAGTEAPISVADLGDHSGAKRLPTLETMITREFFEALCAPLLARSLEVCKQVLASANCAPSSVDSVLLVGGMTRVPMVQRLVAECFGKNPVSGMNPDEVVALGAAVHAAELADKTGEALLIDVASHSVGVGVLGGGMQWLIPKNSPVPATATKTFLPSHGGQKDVRLPIFQGESDRADENTRLGELWLHELPSADRAEVPIDVRFELASDGTLSVRAVDTTSGVAEAVSIQARTDLSAPEVERLQKDEASYAREATQRNAARTAEQFALQLKRAEAFAKVLAKSADENPSDEAFRAVGEFDALLERGRAALGSRDREQMAQVARLLAQLSAT